VTDTILYVIQAL